MFVVVDFDGECCLYCCECYCVMVVYVIFWMVGCVGCVENLCDVVIGWFDVCEVVYCCVYCVEVWYVVEFVFGYELLCWMYEVFDYWCECYVE